MARLIRLDDRKFRAIACFIGVSAASVASAQTTSGTREAIPTLSGYMEVHLNKEQDLPTQADLHRFVLMIGHTFSDRLKFWSEVEVEHAFVEGAEESGEVAIEQAFVDLMLHRRFNLRAGMVLMPVGIVNEQKHRQTEDFELDRISIAMRKLSGYLLREIF